MKIKKEYINKKQFSKEVYDYVIQVNKAKKEQKEIPIIPNSIGIALMDICINLAKLPNFSGYTFKEDMIMDAVENCVKAIQNFNFDAETKTGFPNAFGYFTTIAFRAMVRRIVKEKKFFDLKTKIKETAIPEDFIDNGDETINHYIENIISYSIKD